MKKRLIYLLILLLAVVIVNTVREDEEEGEEEQLLEYSIYAKEMLIISNKFKILKKECYEKYNKIKEELIKNKEELFKNLLNEKEFNEFLKYEKIEDDKIKKRLIKEIENIIEKINIKMKEEEKENGLSIKEKIKVVKQGVLNNFNLIKNNLGNELNRKEKLVKELEANLNELNNLIKEGETKENIKEKVETIKKSLKNATSFKNLINLEKVEESLKDKSEKVLKNIKTGFVKKAEKLMKKENEKFKKNIERMLATEESLLKILTLLEQILEKKKSHKNVVKMFEKAEKGFKNEIELLKKYFNKNDEIQNALQYNIQTLTNLIYEIKIEIKEYEEIIVKVETVENKLKNMSGFNDVLQNLETLRNSLINGESKKQVVIKLESLKTSFEKNKEMFMEVIRKNMGIFNRINYYLNNVEKEKYKKYQNKWKIPVLEDFDLKLLENENLKDFVINLKQYSLTNYYLYLIK